MDPSHAFESLAGLSPGRSRVGEAVARFGSVVNSEESEGGLFFSFNARGLHLIVYQDQRDAPDPVVAEVRLTPPSVEELPCGVRIGQPQAAALDAVRRSYRVVDEYEDAVYFRPSARDDLLASVEFLRAGLVVSIELIHQHARTTSDDEERSQSGRTG